MAFSDRSRRRKSGAALADQRTDDDGAVGDQPRPQLEPIGAAGSAFATGGGEMGVRMRAFDWSTTPLGPITDWPQSLKTSVEFLMHSPVPLVMLWGTAGVMIYNDAYSVFAGGRHPRLLGSPVLEGWPEVAEFNRTIMEAGLAGRTLSFRDQHLVLNRHGVPEDVWMHLDYSPVYDESGRPAGVMAIVVETTKRVRSEKRLRERERELARVQQIGMVGGVEVDLREGFKNQRSPEYLLIHGLPPDATNETHEDWVRRLHPEDRARIEREFLDAVAGEGVDYQTEYRIVRPNDGQVRWIAVKAEIERDAAGKALRLVGAHIDITDRKFAEERLRESEQRFRLIADSAPVPMWVTKLDGKRAFVNQAYMDFLGLSFEDSCNFDWRKALYPEDLPRILKEQQVGEGSRKPFHLEARYRNAKGEWRWLRSESQPRWGPTGEHIGFIGVAHDITAAKQAEVELRRLNETLEEQVEARTRERDRIWVNSSELMAVASFDGFFKAVNPAWNRLLGYDASELLSRPFAEFLHTDDIAPAFDATQRMRHGESLRNHESRMRHADGGYRLISWTAVPEKNVFYAIGRDITEQRETEEALRQAQKMEAVGQLTGGIAHDFNNLLTGIIGSLDILRRRMAAGRTEGIDRYIEAAVTSANRAAGLTHRLLAFSRRQSLDLKPIDINQLVASMEELLHRSLGERVRCVARLSPDLWTAEVDRNQLETALLNLAINARDAMPDGGTLTVETHNVAIAPPRAAAEGLAPGEYVQLCVSDSGVGMSQEVIDRAFDPFFTTKPIGQGTGLGLSMVCGFARQSRGHVRIDSEVGRGTSVKLFLPRYRGDAIDTVESADEAMRQAAPGETILLVEDDPVVRLLVSEVLQELGYRALTVNDGKAAVPILQSAQRIDLLVTDVGLPGINGRQVAEIARQSRPDLKVLFITGYAETAAIRGEFLAPGMDLIAKPFALNDLAAKLREMTGR